MSGRGADGTSIWSVRAPGSTAQFLTQTICRAVPSSSCWHMRTKPPSWPSARMCWIWNRCVCLLAPPFLAIFWCSMKSTRIKGCMMDYRRGSEIRSGEVPKKIEREIKCRRHRKLPNEPDPVGIRPITRDKVCWWYTRRKNQARFRKLNVYITEIFWW